MARPPEDASHTSSSPSLSMSLSTSSSELIPSNIFLSMSASNNNKNRVSSDVIGSVIGPTHVKGMTACPCCNRPLRDEHRQTLDEPPKSSVRTGGSLLNNMDEDDYSESEHPDDDLLPGVLDEGVEYTPKKIIVGGWVHKKGTGKDWMGSRGWKPRWARLALAKVSGYEVDVPILLIYWYSSSPTPSTVISLDSAVVLPFEAEDKTRWDSFQFQIQHVKTTGKCKSVQATREFTVPYKARDAWVYSINEALLTFEKEKARARKAASPETVRKHPLPSVEQTASPGFLNSIWSGDQFLTVQERQLMGRLRSPPSSPQSSPRTTARTRKIPRPARDHGSP